MYANLLQASAIERYWIHLVRAGVSLDLETAARLWIVRYAQLWRAHYGKKGMN